MRKTIPLLASAILLAASIPAVAAPDGKATNAAYPDSGTGCLVQGSETDPLLLDPDCKFHIVRKYDKDGNQIWFHYQDKGTLQPGNEVPTSTVRIDLSGGGCTGAEVVTKNGNYSSDLTCK